MPHEGSYTGKDAIAGTPKKGQLSGKPSLSMAGPIKVGPAGPLPPDKKHLRNQNARRPVTGTTTLNG